MTKQSPNITDFWESATGELLCPMYLFDNGFAAMEIIETIKESNSIVYNIVKDFLRTPMTFIRMVSLRAVLDDVLNKISLELSNKFLETLSESQFKAIEDEVKWILKSKYGPNLPASPGVIDGENQSPVSK